ncbi:MAG: zf-HC2 domain-containing protein [Burkholderiales bacterium]
MMLPCKEVTRLVSQSLDRRLGLMERVGLYLHFRLCDGCRRFREQMAFIHHACQRYPY